MPITEDDCGEDTWDLTMEDAIRSNKGGYTLTLPLFKRYTKEYGYPKQDEGESDKAYNKRVADWRESARIPISHMHIPASQVLPLMSGDSGITRAFVRTEKIGFEVARQWPDTDLGKKCKENKEEGAKKHTILTYVDEHWVAYIAQGKEGWKVGPIRMGSISGEILDSWPHKMRVCPLAITLGDITSDPRPQYRMKSRLYDVMPLAKEQDRLWSRQLTMIKVMALSSPIVKTTEEQGARTEAPGRRISLSSGEPISLYKDEEVLPPLQYPLQPEAEALGAKLAQQIERLSLVDVLRGITGADQSGIAIHYRTQAAQSEYTPLGEHLADGRRRQAQMVLRAVIALGEEVKVTRSKPEGEEKVSCTPELAERHLNNVHIELNPSFPEDRGADLDNVGKAIELGYPREKAWEKFADETEPQKLMDEAIASEWLWTAGKAALEREALKRADLLAAQEQLMAPSQAVGMMGELPPGLQSALGQQGMGLTPGPTTPPGPGMVPETASGATGGA
jgi:hypothetical protein